jgi:hypothetical protein
MAKPKLALIPSAQGSKFYSVLPSSGVGDFNFSRSGSATRINSQGLIESVANGVSRLNYPMIDGVVKGCPHHILEPQRSNSFSYSQDFSNSYWTKSGSSISSDLTISPDGTLNADKLIENSDTVEHFLRRSIAVPIGFYTWSVFVKASDRKYIVLRTNSDGGAYKNACFDVELGIVVYDGLHNSEANIEAFPNGWYRISALSKETSGTTRNYQIHVSNSPIVNNSGISYNGDGTSGIYLYGIQLELGHRSSYIPTTTSAVTRSAETANGSGDASTFNDSEGVLMVEISALHNDGLSKNITISDGTSSNRVFLKFSSTSNILEATVVSGGVVAMQETYSISDTTLYSKLILKYKQNDFSFWVNGFEVGTDSSGNTPTGLDVLDFDSGIGVNDFYGNNKQIQYYDSALNDNELEQLTSWVSFQDMAEGQLYTIE